MRENVEVVFGDITNSEARYIAHQCNCVTEYSLGLAKSIFEKFPYSDCYQGRKEKDVPGTIKIFGNGVDQRYVINMFGQYYPGKPRHSENQNDRISYFRKCLEEITKITDLESIAFPKNIGCGLAGGNWSEYFNEISIFASKTNAKVFIYDFKGEN